MWVAPKLGSDRFSRFDGYGYRHPDSKTKRQAKNVYKDNTRGMHYALYKTIDMRIKAKKGT